AVVADEELRDRGRLVVEQVLGRLGYQRPLSQNGETFLLAGIVERRWSRGLRSCARCGRSLRESLRGGHAGARSARARGTAEAQEADASEETAAVDPSGRLGLVIIDGWVEGRLLELVCHGRSPHAPWCA